ncbi:MAG: serine/threonine-protein kinase [Burkholderiales bacterium]
MKRPNLSALRTHDALPHGTRFGEFEIIRVLGVGGFGVVYLANDYSLERQVALKEYMPASLAVRGEGARITVRSESLAETYAIGLRSFVNEARLLARFDHPSLVKVYRFWEDNSTAYMVMPYLQGVNLRDSRRAMPNPPDETWIRGVLDPMLDALEQLHGEGVFHRDVAPDNILLPLAGAPILLDFGAARRVISDRTQSLTAILKPSYAPIEQYAEMSGMRQGPWTDIYALGAVMHFLLFGVPPAPSTARAVQDDPVPIEHRVVPGVSPRFMSVVAWMLGVRPLERPQNVAQMRAALRGEIAIPTRARKDVTVPGDTALLSVAAPAPFPPTQLATRFEPTLRVEGAYSAPTRLDTAHQPTRLDTAHQPTMLINRPDADATAVAPPPSQTRARAAADPEMVTHMVAPSARRAAAAPAAVPVAPAAAKASNNIGLLIAGVAVLVIAAGVAVWQFGGASRPHALPPATQVATPAKPAVATPDVGPSIANVASVPQWGNGASVPKPSR